MDTQTHESSQRPEGRPTVVTRQVLSKLRDAFLMGCSDREACFYADIAPSTLYEYQRKNPEFSEQQKAMWKQYPNLLARQELIKGLKGNPTLALKFLERRCPEEFSLRRDLRESNDNGPIFVFDDSLRGIVERANRRSVPTTQC